MVKGPRGRKIDGRDTDGDLFVDLFCTEDNL